MENYNKPQIVFGIDILPGYSVDSSNKQPHYALVILREGQVYETYEDVSFSRLIRLVWEYKPDILAIDNVFELVRNTNELIEFMKIIPSKTQIIQVTGWGQDQEPLEAIAYKLGIETHGKSSPVKTAFLAAYIAYNGGGAVIKLLEEKTKIIVSRGRSVGHGGMSYDRFKRSIRAGILNVTREIRKILDSNGFDYDLIFKRSKGGLEKSIFIVYASRDKLYGLIKPLKNKSVRVTIKPVYRNKIVFEEKNEKRTLRGLILGIDPGIYTGIAVIDLNGRPLFTYSSKNLDRSEIIGIVSRLGEVVIVATDTRDPPEIVKKISSILNAKLYTPSNDLSTEEKQEIVNKLVKRYKYLEVKNSHIRDALAAAYKAYTWVKDKLENINSRLNEIHMDIDIEKIKINVIKGKSFAEALEEELDKYIEKLHSEKTIDNEVVREEKNEVIEKYKNRIEKLRNKISYLEATIRELMKKLEEKDRLIEELRLELKIARKKESSGNYMDRKYYLLKQEVETLSREIEERDKEIDMLRSKIRVLEDILNKLWSGKYIVVPRIKNLCLSNIKRIHGFIREKIVYVDELYPIDNEVVNYLKKEGIGVITSRDYGELYKDLRIPVVKTSNIYVLEDKVIVEKNIVDVVEEIWRVIDELDSEDEYKKVLRLIREYQEMRKKKFSGS